MYRIGIIIIAIISLLVSLHFFPHFTQPNPHPGLFLRLHLNQLARFPSLYAFPFSHPHPHSRYERLSWIPVLIVYIVALGVGGKHLSNPPAASPTTAASALSFASVIAGFVLTYAPLGSDYTTYMDPKVSR